MPRPSALPGGSPADALWRAAQAGDTTCAHPNAPLTLIGFAHHTCMHSDSLSVTGQVLACCVYTTSSLLSCLGICMTFPDNWYAAVIPPTTYRFPSDHRRQIGLGLTSTALRNHVGTRGAAVYFLSFLLLLCSSTFFCPQVRQEDFLRHLWVLPGFWQG